MTNFARTYKNWLSVRNTEHQLRKLSERELEDIGFARGDIEFAARAAAKRVL